MTRINLLPWRDVRRAQRQRDLIIMLAAAALLAVGMVYLVHTEIASRIEFQQQRNEYLRGEIARLKKAAEELAKHSDSIDAELDILGRDAFARCRWLWVVLDRHERRYRGRLPAHLGLLQ